LPAKTQIILDIVVYFLSWVMMGTISWQLINRALTVKADHEMSTILYIPTFPFVLVAGLGCTLLTLVFFTQSLDKWLQAVKK
jgi:hypothetical protein